MKLDPAKPYGTIYGRNSEYPTAKYTQDGFLYDASHKCLNPDEGKTNVVDQATAELIAKKEERLKTLLKEVEIADAAVKADASAANKSKLTKATNAYNKLVEEINVLEGN